MYYNSYDWRPKIVLANGSRKYALVSIDMLPM